MLSSRGVMEGGGGEAQGQEAGQKMCKLFLTHYNRVLEMRSESEGGSEQGLRKQRQGQMT